MYQKHTREIKKKKHRYLCIFFHWEISQKAIQSISNDYTSSNPVQNMNSFLTALSTDANFVAESISDIK